MDVDVRPLRAGEAEGVRTLQEQSADGGRIAFRRRHHVPADEIPRGHHGDDRTVVAITPTGQVVGAASVAFDRVSDGAARVELAWLHSLAVDPSWRRRGIAGRLSDALLGLAEERSPLCVVAAAIQAGNDPSRASAARWTTRELGVIRVTPVPPPRRQPAAARHIHVRAATSADLQACSDGLAGTAAGLSLAPTPDASALAAWVDARVAGTAVHELLVAGDRAGRIVAGLGIEDEGAVSSLEVVRMPPVVAVATRLLRVVPADRLLRNLNVRMPWCLPGRERELRQLVQHVRWSHRARGSGLVTAVDPRAPYAAALRSAPWYPSTSLRVVVREPPGIALRRLPLGVRV
jgi:predicted N-acetyltransferase YhbS